MAAFTGGVQAFSAALEACYDYCPGRRRRQRRFLTPPPARRADAGAFAFIAGASWGCAPARMGPLPISQRLYEVLIDDTSARLAWGHSARCDSRRSPLAPIRRRRAHSRAYRLSAPAFAAGALFHAAAAAAHVTGIFHFSFLISWGLLICHGISRRRALRSARYASRIPGAS